MRKAFWSILLLAVVLSLPGFAAQAYYVKIKDLRGSPTPPNPVTVSGKVTNAAPLTINDGSGELIVTGLTACLDDFLVVRGNSDGSVLAMDGHTEGFVGPARTAMVYIPAGIFLMGNSGVGDDAIFGDSNEFPQHSVYLSGYWIGKYEVTRGQYRAFVNAGGYSNSIYWSTDGWNWKESCYRTQPDHWDPVQTWGWGNSFMQTDNHPVVGVSYFEAEAFCKWAGGRLPTEAEWEKAAKWDGSNARVYPWGNDWNDEKCNNWYDSLCTGMQTAPVGSYQTGISRYGIHDMAGNVLEWLKDWYNSTYYAQTPLGGWVDPQGPENGSYRVLRGGCWYDEYDYCRSAYRDWYSQSYSNYYLGFRLAR